MILLFTKFVKPALEKAKHIYGVVSVFAGNTCKKLINLINSLSNKVMTYIKEEYIVDGKLVLFKTAFAKKTATLVASGVGAICLSVCLLAVLNTFTVSLAVKYDGKTVGYVLDEKTVAEANIIMKDSVLAEDTDGLLKTVDCSITLVSKSKLVNAQQLADIALENNDNLANGSVLYIDGAMTLACEDKETLQSNLDAVLDANVDETCVSSKFSQNVEVINGYFPKSFASSTEEVNASFESNTLSLTVEQIKKVTYTEEIPYDTEEKTDSAKIVGYVKVVNKGKNGLANVTAEVTYHDGVEVDSKVLETTVVEEPVNEVKVVGSAKVVNQPARNSLSSGNGKLCFPVEINARTYVSSYWGDGRGHKGVDLATYKNSEIYAAEKGTVCEAGYRRDYGYYMIVDHGNGMKTLYSHCNSLKASKGDKVVRGQVIALVGSTGRSTGNHLHFEVILNGSRVNPASYIGLK